MKASPRGTVVCRPTGCWGPNQVSHRHFHWVQIPHMKQISDGGPRAQTIIYNKGCSSETPHVSILSLMARMWVHFRAPTNLPCSCQAPGIPASQLHNLQPCCHPWHFRFPHATSSTPSPELPPKQRPPPPPSGPHPGLHLHLVSLSPASAPSSAAIQHPGWSLEAQI